MLAAPSCSNDTSDDGAVSPTETGETAGGGSSTTAGGGTAGGGTAGGGSNTPSTEGFVLISAGTFTRTDGTTSQNVTLTRDYYMCDHEVTQGEYQAVMGSNPSEYDSEAADGEVQANRPVENVNWYQAIAYCNKLSINQGLQPCYTVGGSSTLGNPPANDDETWNAATCDFTKNGYRLPTEAEWEYAARAEGTTASNGWSGTETGNEVENYAWYQVISGDKTHEVKKKLPNAKGLYDMSGNVYEWCYDRYGSYSDSSGTDPIGHPSNSERVRRGGSWSDSAGGCAVSYRFYNNAGYEAWDLGFRVCRSAQSGQSHQKCCRTDSRTLSLRRHII